MSFDDQPTSPIELIEPRGDHWAGLCRPTSGGPHRTPSPRVRSASNPHARGAVGGRPPRTRAGSGRQRPLAGPGVGPRAPEQEALRHNPPQPAVLRSVLLL